MIKLTFVGINLLILAVIVLEISLSPNVYGIISREYEAIYFHHSDKLCEFRVKLIIETEDDGTWRLHKSYQIDILLSVIFINFSYFEGLKFGNASIDLQPDIPISQTSWVALISIDRPIFNHKIVDIRVFPNVEGRVRLYPFLDMHPYGSKKGVDIAGWNGEEPTYITIKKEEADIYRTLIYILAPLVVILTVTTTYFGNKFRKIKTKLSLVQTKIAYHME